MRTAAVVLVAALVAADARAEQAQGFVELRGAYQAGVTGRAWQLVERVRPTLSAELAERVKLVATVEAGFAQGRDRVEEVERILRASSAWPALQASGWRSPEYANSVLRINDGDDYLDVDRLHLDFYGGSFDLRIGRQALNWGSAQFFNPTDPFPEVLLAEPWRPRRGVNAVRLNVPWGAMRDASMVVATNDALTDVRAAGRVRVNWKGADFAVTGAWRGEQSDALVGIDLRGTLGVGWWVEAAYLLGDNPHEEVTAGLDYSFPVLERATVFVQYHRNGAGAARVSAAELVGLGGFTLSPNTKRDPFAPFTRGRDYGMAGATLGVLPELNASFAALQNLGDGSGVAIPTVTWAALDWLEIAASAQVPYAMWGDGGELQPRKQDLQVAFGSETLDLGGLVPAATFTLWARASY